MSAVLAFILAAVVLVVAVERLAERSGLPTAALLTLGGLVYAVLPGPNLQVPPEVVLTIILPPLLYSAALNSSLIAIRQNKRPIISLSVILVLVTAMGTGLALHLFVPAISLAAAIAVGAATAPPDPVAALSVGRRAGLPARLITLIEGEGLLNDATALTALTVAVASVSSGGFSPGFAVLRFLGATAGGAVAGIVVAIVIRTARPLLHDALLVNTVSLATPFAAYLQTRYSGRRRARALGRPAMP